MFKIFKITDKFKCPLYKNGQRLLCKKIRENSTLFIGDTILYHQNPYGLSAKRITFINVNKVYLESITLNTDNSKSFGYLDKRDLEYKVLLKF